jgi:hypothetical protein
MNRKFTLANKIAIWGLVISACGIIISLLSSNYKENIVIKNSSTDKSISNTINNGNITVNNTTNVGRSNK